MKIINWAIYQIYNMEPTIDNKNLTITNYPDFLQTHNDIIMMVKQTKLICSPIIDFNLLCNKYIKNYIGIIGNSDIYTDSLITNDIFKPTITDLVSRINIVFNNDININNSNQYDLTFYSMKLLDINFNSTIYDLNNTSKNTLLVNSNFTFLAKNNYTKTVINDFNLLYNLSCLLLNNYSINYSKLYDDYNLIQNFLIKSTTTVNGLFEMFKGYVSNYSLSSELSSINNFGKYEYFLSKTYNIQKLNHIVSRSNNLSLITPNDYDNLPIMINYNYAYDKFYNKYFMYNYNYNNFENNYTVIYKNLYSYYLNIVKNSNAIKNIKHHNMNLYVWLFIDLINSFISTVYYDGTNSNISNSYIPVINQIIHIYFTYNYSFRLNLNISDVKNLFIQAKYSNVPTFTNYVEINNYLVSYYYYQLFSTDIEYINNSEFKYDVKLFFNTLNDETNINFIYGKNFLNCILKFEVIVRFIMFKITNIYKINMDILYNHIDNCKTNLIEYITNIDNIINYFNNQYIKNLGNSYTSSNYEYIFSTINNLVNKKEFYCKFSHSVSDLIYWINNDSYDVNIVNTWTKYFCKIYFEYYEYVDNQYVIKTYTLDIFTFYYLIYTYIHYILLKNTEFIDNINSEFTKIYQLLFKHEKTIINPDIINDILEFKYNVFSNENTQLNFLNISDTTQNLKMSSIINTIFKYILNDYWGIINYNIIENIPQLNLRSYITFYNLYYSYLNYLIINTNAYGNSQYNFEYYSNIFDELYILYSLIIETYIIKFINIPTYYTLEQECLTKSHQYIMYGIKINTLDINSNFAVYMDNLNSNIIINNKINNYYKIIQNDSIYDCVKYKLHTFKNNINNYSDYIIQIYNNQIIKFNFNDENTLGSNTFYNIIINTYSNLTTQVNIYLKNQNTIINSIINTLFTNINSQFSLAMQSFGGINNDNISINNSFTQKIFNINNFKNENKQITIFTLIYNQISNENLYNNIPIILFYYSCFITWSTLGLKAVLDIGYLGDLFYNLTNIINTKIILFLNNPDNISSLDLFFDGLNTLMFNNYNNWEFIVGTTNYFNQLIMLNYNNLSNSVSNNLIEINNLLMSNDMSNNILNDLNKNMYMNKNTNLMKIPNNKIVIWKYLTGLLFDFNESKIIYYIKSMDNVFNDLKIQQELIDYIILINDGLINNYGVIQLINRMELLFDDEIISQYYNFNYKTFIDNFQNINKQRLLDDMLGLKSSFDNLIITGLKPYIKYSYKRNYIIPVKFFFENYFNSIPLISCMNTNVKIITYLNNTNIYKNSYYIKYLTSLNITTKLNSDFILLERDERIKLSSNKIDNLIERNNYYELVVNPTKLLLNKTNVININFDFDLDNLVKEIIWTFKITISKYEITIYKNIDLKKNFFNFLQNGIGLMNNLNDSSYDFILNTKFYLNGLRRDGVVFLDADTIPNYNQITTILNPYRYNTKVKLEKHYNVYSFALEPTEFQPSGAINMSNYKMFRIQVQIDKYKFLKYINELNTIFNLKDINFKMLLTTYEYNVVRYQSSLAGLLFIA